MGEGISRRSLVAAAGAAAVAVSACTNTKSTKDNIQNQMTIEDYLKSKGLDNHGDNPNDQLIQLKTPFEPMFIVILHVYSNGAFNLDINHAHYEIPKDENTVDGRSRLAQRMILEKVGGGYRRFKHNINSNPLVYEKTRVAPLGYADYLNSYYMGFNSQHEIFIFYHSTDILLEQTALVRFGRNLIDESNGKTASENKSFYHARIETDVEDDLKKIGQLVRMENYLIDRGEKDSEISLKDQPTKYYSMKLIYRAPDSNIWMNIDPDTGNGAGNEP